MSLKRNIIVGLNQNIFVFFLIFICLPINSNAVGFQARKSGEDALVCLNSSTFDEVVQCAHDYYWATNGQLFIGLGGSDQCKFDLIDETANITNPSTFDCGERYVTGLFSSGTFIRTDIPLTVNCSLHPSDQGRKQFHICLQNDGINPDKNRGATCPTNGTNPVNIANGNKYQEERDYTGAGVNPIQFTRTYNSQGNYSGPFGIKWIHSFSESVEYINIARANNPSDIVYVSQRDGNRFLFSKKNTGQWTTDPDVTIRLEELVDGSGVRTGWKLITTDDKTEEYDADVRLISITNRSGLNQTFDYDVVIAEGGDDDSSTLDKITDSFGRVLTFTYDATGRINNMTDPAGGIYNYTYDVSNNLISVSYPDNKIRIYHYEDTNFPNYLTGITDENGNRFATWGYDTEGRAILSEHNSSTERVEIAYNPDLTTTITDALGNVQTHHFETHHGVVKTSQIDGGPCTSCSGQNQVTTYDANGFVASRTDFNGNQTTFINDSRGLQTSRTEAVGTAEERTITTEWHATFRLPTRISEPGKVTTFTYDSQGRLLERRVTGL